MKMDVTLAEIAEEKWLPVPNLNGYYEVSNIGRVRRSKPSRGARIGHILSPTLREGYPRVGLYPYGNGKQVTRDVHRLVALAFLGPCLDGEEVNHKNGIRYDNRLENLEYVSPSENQFHASRVLGSHLGEKSGVAKLNPTQVRQIRQLYEAGLLSQSKLGAQFGVSRSCIEEIVQRKTWAWID